MVQSQHDGATSSAGAHHFFAQLPNARRVYVPNEFQYGLFSYADACVDTNVVRYLLGEAPPERETTCPAQPLQQDAAPAAPKAAVRSMAAPGPSHQPRCRAADLPQPRGSEKAHRPFQSRHWPTPLSG